MKLRTNARYDWDKWPPGKVHTIRKGEDFKCQAESMVGAIRYRARTKNQTVIVNHSISDNDTIHFQFNER